jgi:hypothetical protein
VVAVTGVGGYRAPPESFMATTHRANSAKMLRFRIPAKLCSSETLLERLAYDLEDTVAELGPFIQEKHAVWCARDTAPGSSADPCLCLSTIILA